MITLGSFIHRAELDRLLTNWLMDQPQPGDPEKLKKLVNFNSYLIRILLRKFFEDLLKATLETPFDSIPANTKGIVKDFLANHTAAMSSRAQALIKHYKKYPQDYYRETPYEGCIYCRGDKTSGHYVGSVRIKRFRRISEKISRRIIDFIFDQIKQNADKLAEERASRLGIPKHQLITSPEEQIAEFQHAERRVLKQIRLGRLTEEIQLQPIMDIGGAKLNSDNGMHEKALNYLRNQKSIRIIEEEIHSGRYNATNIIVEYNYDKDYLLKQPPNDAAIKVFESRGIEASRITEEFRDFVRSGEPSVFFEIILASYEETLESEIGRAMHEDRIIEQRRSQQYRGALAKNVEYLMLFLFTFCFSTVKTFNETPIKLWVKYMPDSVDAILKNLYEFPREKTFDAYIPYLM